MAESRLTAPVRIAAPPDSSECRVEREPSGEVAFSARAVRFFYGPHLAIQDVTLDIPARQVTALIGPSGCGKTTFLRCLNRMNDEICGARMEGSITYRGADLYADGVEPTAVR